MPPSRSWFRTSRGGAVARRAPDVEMRFDTRAKVEPPRRFACHRCGQPAPCARPARRKGDWAGRSPGLRVVTLAPPSQACAQWHLEEGSPPTVAGAAPDLARFVHAAPDSLLAGRGRHTCTAARVGWLLAVCQLMRARVPGVAHCRSPDGAKRNPGRPPRISRPLRVRSIRATDAPQEERRGELRHSEGCHITGTKL